MAETAPCAPPQRLRGRRRETCVVEAAVRAVTGERRGAVITIVGENGSGKTSLLDVAARQARRQGAPFLATTASAPDRCTLAEPRLRRAVARTPLVVAVDDLQAADNATLRLIRGLTGRLTDQPILWLLTLTPGRADLTSHALTRAGATTLNLGPLEHDAVRALAGDVLGGRPGAAVLDLIDDLGGHPGPIVELLGVLRDQRLIEVTDGSARLAGQALRRVLCTPGARWPAPAGGVGVRATLTRAELAVAELVARGATNRQAAERLFLSPHTVSSHLRHTFEKLGIRSRIELAILFAADLGATG